MCNLWLPTVRKLLPPTVIHSFKSLILVCMYIGIMFANLYPMGNNFTNLSTTCSSSWNESEIPLISQVSSVCCSPTPTTLNSEVVSDNFKRRIFSGPMLYLYQTKHGKHVSMGYTYTENIYHSLFSEVQI